MAELAPDVCPRRSGGRRHRFSLASLVLAACLYIRSASALYEDQVGKVDWTKENIGAIRGAIYEAKRAFVWSDARVLAAVNARTGAIEWRTVMPDGVSAVDAAVLHKDKVLTLTGGGRHLWSWRASDGALVWDVAIHPQAPDVATCTAQPQLVLSAGGTLAIVTCSGGGSVRSADDGDEVEVAADVLLPEGFQAVGAAAVDAAAVAIIGQVKGEGRAVVVRGDKREVVKAASSGGEAWPKGSALLWSGASSSSLLLLTTSSGSSGVALHRASLSSLGLPAASAIHSIQGAPPTLLSTDSGEVWELKQDKAKRVVEAQPGSGAVTAVGFASDHLFFFSRGGDEAGIRVLHLPSAAEVAKLPLPSSGFSTPTRLFPQVFDAKTTGGKGFRALVVDAYHTTAMLQQSRTVWVREESLASVESLAFVDYIPQHLLAGTGLDQHHLPTLDERLRLQVRKVQGLWKWAQTELEALKTQLTAPTTTGTANQESEAPSSAGSADAGQVADARSIKFGLSKLAVLTTRPGRLVALHLSDGKVAWTLNLPQPLKEEEGGGSGCGWSVMVSRPTPQLGYMPELLAVSKAGDALWIDAVTGQETRRESGGEVALVVPLEVTAEDGSHAVLLVNKDKRGRFVGGADGAGSGAAELVGRGGLFFHELDREHGRLTAYQVTAGQAGGEWPLGAEVVASAQLPEGETVLAVEYPDPLEVIASPAQVLGDNALLLKYLNPHVLAVATTALTTKRPANSTDAPPPGVADVPTLYVTLLDAISCRVLHRVAHFYASGPVSLAMVENWLVYSYWNTRAQRTELGVVSYYDGFIDKASLNPFNQPEQKSVLSSLDADSPPLGLQKTFIFPRPVTCLGSTNTARGIASKALLIGFQPGGILSLDRRALDPRRPNPGTDPTAAEKAEGLMPYTPHLPLIPQLVLSYNKTIHDLRAIHTMPARLESTSLLVAVGLDLWATRVYPSKTFDILSSDFNHVLVALILVGLMAAVNVVGGWARGRTLKDAWK